MDGLKWIEINTANLERNIKLLRSRCGSQVKMAPCIKGNAYGHGIVSIAHKLEAMGVDALTVFSIDDVKQLRKNGITTSLLVVGSVPRSHLEELVLYNGTLFVSKRSTVDLLDEFAAKHQKKVPVHVKIDTGMSRQGVLMNDYKTFIEYVASKENLVLEAVTTHFACADNVKNLEHFEEQFQEFSYVINHVTRRYPNCMKYCANSSLTMLHPRGHFDMVRPGIAIYGLYPSQEVREECLQRNINLHPVMSFKTRITNIKQLPKERCVSYGGSFRTERDTRIALIPIGYHDGFDRKLSNNGFVLIRGQRAPIIGRICMNITIVDVTDIPEATDGDEVVIIGKQGSEEITVDELAERMGTINYEVVTRLSEEIPRYTIDGYIEVPEIKRQHRIEVDTRVVSHQKQIAE